MTEEEKIDEIDEKLDKTENDETIINLLYQKVYLLEEIIGKNKNLIQKQQEEIEDNNKTINNLIKEQKEREKYTYSLEKLIEKKDNAMNEMAKMINKLLDNIDLEKEIIVNEENYIDCIKKYFESKV